MKFSGSCLGYQTEKGEVRTLLLLTDSFVLEIFTATRQEEVAGIRAKFPNKIPVRRHCTF